MKRSFIILVGLFLMGANTTMTFSMPQYYSNGQSQYAQSQKVVDGLLCDGWYPMRLLVQGMNVVAQWDGYRWQPIPAAKIYPINGYPPVQTVDGSAQYYASIYRYYAKIGGSYVFIKLD